MGQLQSQEATLVDSPQQADVLIINTCGFIEIAKQESVDAILEAERLKRKNPHKKLIVCGCLSERYAAELQKEMPLVDGFFGTEDYENVLRFLNYPGTGSHDFLYEKRILSTPSHYAFLKISEGCNHTCAFCAIPLMRGRHRSRAIPEIVAEAKSLAVKGVKELIVISQDTTFYGLDLYQSQKIVELLTELEKIDGIEWIRLHYLYPTTVQDKLIDYIAASEKVVPYLDMPIQHITNRMLKVMKRGGKSERIYSIFEQARAKIPGLTIRTTLIVGHPGETEEDFDSLKNCIRELKFDRMGVFTYSHEENTSAYHLQDLEEQIKQQRYAELMRIQRKISLEKNLSKVGHTVKVVIDEIDWKHMTAVGRTEGDSPEIDNEVIIEPIDRALNVGDFAFACITDASEYELYGKLGD